MLQIVYSKEFIRAYHKLPQYVQKKIDKQISFLLENLYHPSLNTKRMSGSNHFEARVDKSYRFSFTKKDNTLTMLIVGPHDTGLGKK